MIEQYLNVRNSLRNLSDSEFEDIVPTLALELSTLDYKFNYTEQELYSDWMDLLNRESSTKYVPSTRREGMRLCEHFMPNFWSIQSAKGMSFEILWTAENLERILRYNRKMHSTPYMSEIRRTLYFTFGLPKSTMYRPGLAKAITIAYKGKTVLDPCAGWGGRMLGTVAAGAHYTAFEPNITTYENLLKIVDFLKLHDKVMLFNSPAQEISNTKLPHRKYDVILTSPPYYSLEVYTYNSTQSYTPGMSYLEWVDFFLKPVIFQCVDLLGKSGVSCWNVSNVKKYHLVQDVADIHYVKGFEKVNDFGVVSSARPTQESDAKTTDTTVVYSQRSAPVQEFFTYA